MTCVKMAQDGTGWYGMGPGGSPSARACPIYTPGGTSSCRNTFMTSAGGVAEGFGPAGWPVKLRAGCRGFGILCCRLSVVWWGCTACQVSGSKLSGHTVCRVVSCEADSFQLAAACWQLAVCWLLRRRGAEPLAASGRLWVPFRSRTDGFGVLPTVRAQVGRLVGRLDTAIPGCHPADVGLGSILTCR